MDAVELIILLLAGVAGGVLNAVAGGGGLIAFPALLFTGLGATVANAASMVALWPGNLASLVAYRRDSAFGLRSFGPQVLAIMAGGWLGARLMIQTPAETFLRLVPYLMLLATATLLLGPWLNRRLAVASAPPGVGVGPMSWLRVGGMGLVGVYGGYFGAGLGLLVLAILSVTDRGSLNRQNGLKVALVFCNNGVAAVSYMASGLILWPQTGAMLAGAVLGGYCGAYYGRQMNPRLLRGLTIGTASLLTIYFFIR